MYPNGATYNQNMSGQILHRVAITLLSGIDAAAKARVARSLFRGDRQGWVVLDNDGGRCAAAAGELKIPAAVSEGCACCTGQVTLHAALVSLIRRHRPGKLLLVAAAAAEPAALQRALAQGVAMQAWHVAQHLCVWNATAASAAGCDSRALWNAQRAAADAVILCDINTAEAEINRQLAAASTPAASAPSKASSRQINS